MATDRKKEPAREPIEALRKAACDSMDKLMELESCIDLLTWIERARYQTESIRDLAKIDKDLEQRLARADYRLNASTWDAAESGGLEWLLIQAGVMAAAMRKDLDEVLESTL